MVAVSYSYLTEQFADGPLSRRIMADLRRLRKRGDYTLGPWVERFEEAFAQATGYAHAVGVSNGTDALALALEVVGVKKGDWVLTVPNSFVATAGAIRQVGAYPRFSDVGPDYLMAPDAPLFSMNLRCCAAVVPVDLTGRPALMDRRLLAGPPVILDAAQSVGATGGLKPKAACYSLHPLKNVNVWGDGGVVATDDAGLAAEVGLLRNHGLTDRDTCTVVGYNHRLSAFQAIVGFHVLGALPWITERRRANAAQYDAGLRGCPGVVLPPRNPSVGEVFHTYVVQADGRDRLLAYLASKDVEAKVHYPVPIHLQPAYAKLGYHAGEYPVVESQARRIISLPVHQYLSEEQVGYVVESVRGFYRA